MKFESREHRRRHRGWHPDSIAVVEALLDELVANIAIGRHAVWVKNDRSPVGILTPVELAIDWCLRNHIAGALITPIGGVIGWA